MQTRTPQEATPFPKCVAHGTLILSHPVFKFMLICMCGSLYGTIYMPPALCLRMQQKTQRHIPKHESSFHTKIAKRSSYPARFLQPKPYCRRFPASIHLPVPSLGLNFFLTCTGSNMLGINKEHIGSLSMAEICYWNILLQWPRAIWRVKVRTNSHCVKPSSCQRKSVLVAVSPIKKWQF